MTIKEFYQETIESTFDSDQRFLRVKVKREEYSRYNMLYEICKWLREKYSTHITVHVRMDNNGELHYIHSICTINHSLSLISYAEYKNDFKMYNTYENALKSAIRRVIKDIS